MGDIAWPAWLDVWLIAGFPLRLPPSFHPCPFPTVQNIAYFAVLTVLVAVVLSREYVSVAKAERVTLDKKTKTFPSDVEASAWAVFSTNTKFLVSRRAGSGCGARLRRGMIALSPAGGGWLAWLFPFV